MLIGNHPELKHWCARGGVAYPAPFPSMVELARLVVRDICCRPPSGIKFILEHGHGQCGVVKRFKDKEFAKALFQQRYKCIGLRLSVLQYVEIDYRPVRVIALDHMIER